MLPDWMELMWGVMSAAWAAIVIVILVALVRALARRGGSVTTTARPGLRVLEERYARGEISRDEFLERKAVLTEGER